MNRRYKKIAVASPTFSKNEFLLKAAQKLCDELVVNEDGKRFSETELVDWLNASEADCAIIGTEPLSAVGVNGLKHVQAIGKFGVGCDNIDLEAIKENNILFSWEGGVNRRSVAEMTLSFMIGHCRNIFRTIDLMQRGEWFKNGGILLSGRTVGIVGFGHIGKELALLLKNFNCKILYCDIIDKRQEAESLGASSTDYLSLVGESDIVTFHVPGTSATRLMYGEREIGAAKQAQLVINTSRGSVVDFPAVTAAVKTGRLGGYAADVYPTEPFLSTEFKVADGFYFTPHIGGNAAEAVIEMGLAALRNL